MEGMCFGMISILLYYRDWWEPPENTYSGLTEPESTSWKENILANLNSESLSRIGKGWQRTGV